MNIWACDQVELAAVAVQQLEGMSIGARLKLEAECH